MSLEPYGRISNWDSLKHFFYKSEMTRNMYNNVEMPSLQEASEQEKILKKMVNKNYYFQLWINRSTTGSISFSPVLTLELIFLDELTKTEYELLK
jgi:hypothetical protein